jgi:hypothetical protein
MTSEGMWILDQGHDNWVSLVNVADGKVIREFKTDVECCQWSDGGRARSHVDFINPQQPDG